MSTKIPDMSGQQDAVDKSEHHATAIATITILYVFV